MGTEETPPATGEPDDGMTTDAGKRALQQERAKVKELERQIADLKPLADAAREAEDANKTELQRLGDQVAQLTQERDAATAERARLSVALEKGLTPTQAKRLVGSTPEEIAADADQLLADLGISSSASTEQEPEATTAPGNRQEQLAGGIDPTASTISSDEVRAAVDAVTSSRA